MREIDIRKTQFSVTDLLSWLRDGTLNLNPAFQRRSVWKQDAKSYFIDTVVRGLPAPIIYLRQRVDLDTQRTIREVVDGQQRLRTLFAFVDAESLGDFDAQRDQFLVKPLHNKEIGGKPFGKLSDHIRQRILSYEFSTHVLPINVEDREVLEMFARLNATGTNLNHQELRNAEWFGELKTLMYKLALEQLNRWRDWKIFTDDQISRMREVELTSDLVLNMKHGLTGKTQKRLNSFYEENDERLVGKREISRRFRHTMDQIDDLLGDKIASSIYKSDVYFFSLFVYLYDRMYGLGSTLSTRKPKKLPRSLRARLLEVGERFQAQEVPKRVLDAVQRASSDIGRRRTRLEYLKSECDGRAR